MQKAVLKVVASIALIAIGIASGFLGLWIYPAIDFFARDITYDQREMYGESNLPPLWLDLLPWYLPPIFALLFSAYCIYAGIRLGLSTRKISPPS